jgi:hypothetical protein
MEGDIGRTCNTHDSEKECIHFFSRNLEGSGNLEDVEVHRRIITNQLIK